MAQQYHTNIFNRQRGVVLIATLLMLSILIILVLTLAIVPIGDLKVASNNKDQILAKQAANASLEEAKNWVLHTWANNMALPVLSCNYPTTLQLQNATFTIDGYASNPLSWWAANGCAAQTSPSGVTQKPYYVIKYLGCDTTDSVDLYQIVVRGTGVSTNSVAFSEAIVSFFTTSNLTGVTTSTPGATTVQFTTPWSTNRFVMQRSSNKTLNSVWGTPSPNFTVACPPSNFTVFAQCTRNCAGLLRVSGYSGNTTCQYMYGAWVGPGGTSTIKLVDSKGLTNSISCAQ